MSIRNRSYRRRCCYRRRRRRRRRRLGLVVESAVWWFLPGILGRVRMRMRMFRRIRPCCAWFFLLVVNIVLLVLRLHYSSRGRGYCASIDTMRMIRCGCAGIKLDSDSISSCGDSCSGRRILFWSENNTISGVCYRWLCLCLCSCTVVLEILLAIVCFVLLGHRCRFVLLLLLLLLLLFDSFRSNAGKFLLLFCLL